MISIRFYTYFFQVGFNGISKFRLINKQCCLVGSYQQITDKNGIAMHIRTSEIQRPGYIIERRNQHSINVFLPQGLSDASKLICCRLTSVFQRVYLYGILRNRRSVDPDSLHGINVRSHGETAIFSQFILNFLNHRCRTTHPVDAHFCRSRFILQCC